MSRLALLNQGMLDDALKAHGRDRGTGTTLPTTDLRRGDVYEHTGLGFYVYTGSRWQRVAWPASATRSARSITPTTATAQTYTGGAAYGTIAGITDLVLTAEAGEWVQAGASYAADNQAGDLRIDVATVKNGSVTTYLSGAGAGGHGVLGMGTIGGRYESAGGTVLYQLTAADVADDNTVTLRLLAKATAANRLILKGANDLAMFWAKVD